MRHLLLILLLVATVAHGEEIASEKSKREYYVTPTGTKEWRLDGWQYNRKPCLKLVFAPDPVQMWSKRAQSDPPNPFHQSEEDLRDDRVEFRLIPHICLFR